MNITCLWHGNNILGECPLWDFRTQHLYWIDIVQSQLHQLAIPSLVHQMWELSDHPCAIGLYPEEKLLIAFTRSFAIMDIKLGKITPWFEALTENNKEIFNDGKIDSLGRFWIGSKDLQEKLPTGNLYRLSQDQNFSVMDQGFIVANGMGWSPDQNFFYFTDGAESRRILRYAFDVEAGKIDQKETFAMIGTTAGYPDGLCVDAAGFIWSAHWGGWRITRYRPDGTIERVIQMPIPNPTSCCFGGKDFKTLFITSARRDLTEKEFHAAPLSGNLFAIAFDDIVGLREFIFAHH